MIFASAIQQLGSEQITTTSIMCDDASTWNKGYTILNFMKNVSILFCLFELKDQTNGTSINFNVSF